MEGFEIEVGGTGMKIPRKDGGRFVGTLNGCMVVLKKAEFRSGKRSVLWRANGDAGIVGPERSDSELAPGVAAAVGKAVGLR